MDFFVVLVRRCRERQGLKPGFPDWVFVARKRAIHNAVAGLLFEFFVRTSLSFRVRLHIHVSRIAAK